MKIAIIDYGSGNVRSVQFALERLGAEAFCSANADDISSAEKVIFPGVGAAGNVMSRLKSRKLDQLIPDLKQPILGICIGMQLMCRYSHENNTKGLGIFPVDVLHFGQNEKVPHMGWNTMHGLQGPLFDEINENSHVYYVHSYYVPVGEFSIATSYYQVEFSAVLKKDNFYACQFHPEKSGGVGNQLLNNFLLTG